MPVFSTITNSGPWYDLLQTPNSPRLAMLTEQDLYSWLQYALLEAQQANAALSTGQFSTSDLVAAVQYKRDEFLFRTGCTQTVRYASVTPRVPLVNLLETTIAVRRAYWLPAIDPLSGAYLGNPGPVFRGDEFATASYLPSGPTSPADPQTFDAGIEPPLQVQLNPAPGVPGQIEFLTIESQQPIAANTFTGLLMPSDFVPALYWGALADLMDSTLERKDAPRATYARRRFEQHAEMIAGYPFVLAARVGNLPVYSDAVETLDTYATQWRITTGANAIIGCSGQNLIAYPSDAPANITLLMTVNAPLPTADTDTIQLGRDILDALLDYAQHTASFKMGGEEFQVTMPLFESSVKLAAKRNARVRAMSCFRDILFPRNATRENAITPQMQEATADAS